MENECCDCTNNILYTRNISQHNAALCTQERSLQTFTKFVVSIHRQYRMQLSIFLHAVAF
jgi:hypothetical protein